MPDPGGDYASFFCAGGLQSRDGTKCAEYSQNWLLVNGDDTKQQIADYCSGKSPFLRGTYVMIAHQVGGICNGDPGAEPQFVLQMTWSAGDHQVVRKEIKDLKQLRGKTIAIQRGGPHLGFMDGLLTDAQLTWSDVNVKWMEKLDGPGSPADVFRTDPSVDAAFVITPDRDGLTGGATSVGTGAEGTIDGAHVLVSTAERKRSIGDSYFVRKDWADAHPEELRNFAAAYLYSVEEIKRLEADYRREGSGEYLALVTFAKQTLPVFAEATVEDADFLFQDAVFVGFAGNQAFLDPTSPAGYQAFNERSRRVAQALGLNADINIQPAPIDWSHAVFSGLGSKGAVRQSTFNVEATHKQIEEMTQAGTLGSNTTLSFTAGYAPGQVNFDATAYRAEFDQVLDLVQNYSTAPIAIRCHADPLLAVGKILEAGLKAGVITRTGTKGNYAYFVDGRPLDIENAAQIGQMIHDPQFNRLPDGQNPRDVATGAKTLTDDRCRGAKSALVSYATGKGVSIDENQIVAQGVGIKEPAVALPRSDAEAAANRRVEFSVVRVEVEAANPTFDW